ncbi:hypothetical protein CHUAL_008947 [Chamberlinius hualienensis]
MRIIFNLALIWVILKNGSGYNILILSSLGSTKGHSIYFESIAQSLAANGHQVTFRCVGEMDENENGVKRSKAQLIEADIFMFLKQNPIYQMMYVQSEARKLIRSGYNETLIQDILNHRVNFDLVMMDRFFSEAIAPLAKRIEVPMISISSTIQMPLTAWSANVPFYYFFNFGGVSQPNSFIGRTINLLEFSKFLIAELIVDKTIKNQMSKFYNKQQDDINFKNYSMYFDANSDFSFETSPSTPNSIHIGCSHCRPSRKLPKELESIMENSGEHGVIFFSMGSSIKTEYFPKHFVNKIVNVLSKLPQKILWQGKLNETNLTNFHFFNWLPQQDVLAHPKVKLALIQGGFGTVQEATYHACPIIGFPITLDRFYGVNQAVVNGYGEQLDLWTFTQQQLMLTINKILNNTRYKENAVLASRRMKDVLMNPTEEAVFWTEYVIRHKRAYFLQPQMSDLSVNPFSNLFPSLNDAKKFVSEKESDCECLEPAAGFALENVTKEDLDETNRFIENTFLITVDKTKISSGRPAYCVFLEDVHQSIASKGSENLKLTANGLNIIVFDRLMMTDVEDDLIKTCENAPEAKEARRLASETETVIYLFNCYRRIDRKNKKLFHLAAKCDEIIFEYVALAVKSIEKDEDLPISTAFFTVLFNSLNEKMTNLSLSSRELYNYIQAVKLLTGRPSSAKALIEFSIPRVAVRDPKSFEKLILGQLLRPSPVPQQPNTDSEFFSNVSRFSIYEVEKSEQLVWDLLNRLTSSIYQIFHTLLSCGSAELKSQLCAWIGGCLDANAGRSKMWQNISNAINLTYVSDGFVVNLSNVLLRLCEPISNFTSQKILLIDPTYCLSDFLKCLNEETCLIPSPEDDDDDGGGGCDTSLQTPKDKYNFTTQCFFMTHKCLQIGFNGLFERMTKSTMHLDRLERAYADEVAASGENSPVAENIKKNLEQRSQFYFSSKAQLSEPNQLKMMLKFYAITSKWLINLSAGNDFSINHNITLPLDNSVNMNLSSVPEFIVENLTEFSTFLRRYAPSYFETEDGNNYMVNLLYVILVFMGSPEKMKNPHLRAKLAEALENLTPHPDEHNPRMGQFITRFRDELFRDHPYSSLIVPVLMHVFVSIEMTGQSVAFEQKFNYRRPMYLVFKYIWDIQCHKEAFKKLAAESEANIEKPDAPLFLRFINLLMNDANYLLDEGLLHVSRLRDHQQRRETDEYQNLTRPQREEAEANYVHTGMIARFHNILGRQTINTLKMISSEIKSIFIHPINVERITNMLNYFLSRLVGPKQKELKLKEKEDFEFKPQELVAGICQIYAHLGGSKRFLKAVASDGRCYSEELLDRAETVLYRIGESAMATNFIQVANNIKMTAAKLKLEEETTENVPEEFLDQLLGTVMSDPVILPSSGVTVDRSTIARHLLSDQSDPFNRSHLTMDMVTSDTQLKDKIIAWFAQNKKLRVPRG